MSAQRTHSHFLQRWNDRAAYPIANTEEALRYWDHAAPIPTEPFGIDGRARYWADAEAILVARGDTLVTVLSPQHAIERCTPDQR